MLQIWMILPVLMLGFVAYYLFRKSKRKVIEDTEFPTAPIKDVYIELPNFSFFHSASGRFRDNPKMVGRERVKRKLYGILTNAETKTGSYIITGFRGVGKTSLLNQVINQLQPKHPILRQSFGILTTWGIFHLLIKFWIVPSWIPKPSASVHYDLMYGIIVSLLAIYLLFHLNTFSNFLINDWGKLRRSGQFNRLMRHRLMTTLWNHFSYVVHFLKIDHRIFKRSYSKNVYRIMQYALLIEVFYVWMDIRGGLRLYQLFTVFAIIVSLSGLSRFLIFLVREFKDKRRKRESTDAEKFLRIARTGPFRELLNLFKQQLNHSQKVFVRISFPQDSFESKDVLKSMVHHLKQAYDRYSGFNYWLSRGLRAILFLFIVSAIYTGDFIYCKVVPSLRADTGLAFYFPSQRGEGHSQVLVNFGMTSDTVKRSTLDLTVMQSANASDSSASNTLNLKMRSEDYTSVQGGYSAKIARYTRALDRVIVKTYLSLHTFLDPLSAVRVNGRPAIPKRPDAFLLFFIFIAILLQTIIHRNLRRLGIVTNYHARRLLQDLQDRCMAELNTSMTTNYAVPSPKNPRLKLFSLSKSKKLKYPIAGSREIENDLIYFFDELHRIPNLFARPEFVFVFDELDKVEPSKEDEGENGYSLEGSLESERTRKKREMVSSIMASMKIFFTTAKAKFIFIAGREMYDAALADSSDRDSSLGSIFHDIIYVSSLYKDPFDDHSNRTQDDPVEINHFIEKYVCKHIIPDGENYEHSLKGYSEYLDNNPHLFGSIDWERGEKNKLKKKLRDARRSTADEERSVDKVSKNEPLFKLQKIKTLNLLTAFINYLSFRCKGSPMNLLKLFEDFTEEFPNRDERIFIEQDKYVIGNDPKNYYLTFDYHAQYRVSFVSGLFRPFMIETGLYMKNYSDKIMVSTSYVLDHIYKYHEFGFSWRNLELLPEIIDINRAPLLRRHIEKVISFIADSNLKNIDNGLVNFKFHRKIIEEINYLSKMSDTESAIFHFTLDESYSIKKHYQSRLNRMQAEFNANGKNKVDFVNSISFLQSILGDLYFFDKEYDEAIIQYTNAIQELRKESELDLHQTYLFCRILVKVGLVFERINTVESAFTKYSELIEIIRFHGKRLQAITERESVQNPFVSEYLYGAQASEKDHHFAKSMLENYSLMLMPILLRLVSIERISKQGITAKDSLRADKDFSAVFDFLKKDEKFLIKAEYHLHKGNILYYKNGILYRDYQSLKEVLESFNCFENAVRDFNAPLSAYQEYCIGLSLIVFKLWKNPAYEVDDLSLANSRKGTSDSPNKINETYERFTKNILAKTTNKGEVSKLEKDLLSSLDSFLKLGPSTENSIIKINVTGRLWSVMAQLLSSIGDCLLIMCRNPNLENFDLSSINPFSKNFDLNLFDNRSKLALCMFSFSAICYRRADENRNASFQYKKILFTLKNFSKYRGLQLSDQDQQIKTILLEKVVEPSNRNRNFIIYPEQSKSKRLRVLNDEEAKIKNDIDRYYRSSYNPEVKLSILHYYEINLPAKDVSKEDLFQIPIDSYSPVYDQMVRIHELKLKSRINRKLIKQYLSEEMRVNKSTFLSRISNISALQSNFENDKDLRELALCIPTINTADDDFLRKVIIDSIFCELMTVEIIQFNDVSYLKSHLLLANAYLNLGWWTYQWNKLFGEKDFKDLEEAMGKFKVNYIDDEEYAYQKALSNYYKCINMHSEGDSYKRMLGSMYLSEGDFRDDNQHFCAAVDRWFINHQILRTRIEFVRWLLGDSIFNAND